MGTNNGGSPSNPHGSGTAVAVYLHSSHSNIEFQRADSKHGAIFIQRHTKTETIAVCASLKTLALLSPDPTGVTVDRHQTNCREGVTGRFPGTDGKYGPRFTHGHHVADMSTAIHIPLSMGYGQGQDTQSGRSSRSTDIFDINCAIVRIRSR